MVGDSIESISRTDVVTPSLPDPSIPVIEIRNGCSWLFDFITLLYHTYANFTSKMGKILSNTEVHCANENRPKSFAETVLSRGGFSWGRYLVMDEVGRSECQVLLMFDRQRWWDRPLTGRNPIGRAWRRQRRRQVPEPLPTTIRPRSWGPEPMWRLVRRQRQLLLPVGRQGIPLLNLKLSSFSPPFGDTRAPWIETSEIILFLISVKSTIFCDA